MPNSDEWREHLAAYLAAMRRRDLAKLAFKRTERTFERLAKRMDENRAYFIAGCNFADRASLKAYAAMQTAGELLIQSLIGAPLQDRLSVFSAVYATRLPAPANSNRPAPLTAKNNILRVKSMA